MKQTFQQLVCELTEVTRERPMLYGDLQAHSLTCGRLPSACYGHLGI